MQKHTLTCILVLFANCLFSQIENWNNLGETGDTSDITILHDSPTSIECSRDSTGLIPLTDLGLNYYNGIQGGLYTSGSNVLAGSHKKKGVDISNALNPLDTLGQIDFMSGKVLIYGLGASIASNAFNAYMDTLRGYDYEGVSGCVSIKGMFVAGNDLDDMINLEPHGYWEQLRSKMALKEETPSQVQILWILQHSDSDTTSDFETYHNSVIEKYVTLMQILKDSFPNLKQVYLSGMHYTGYMSPAHKRYEAYSEPRAYWANLVIKDLIQRQITGDVELKYQGANIKSAWIGWGPNFWADGKNARTYDALAWNCDQYRTDTIGGGFHLIDSSYGYGIEASMLKVFMETNPVSSIWFNDGAAWEDCGVDTLKTSSNFGSAENITVFPNPAKANFSILLPEQIPEDFSINIYNELGISVYRNFYEKYTFSAIDCSVELPKGIYVIKLTGKFISYQTKLLIVE